MKAKLIFTFKLFLSLVLLALVLHWIGWETLTETLSNVDPVWLAGGCSFIVVIQVVKSLRMLFLGHLAGLTLTPRRCLTTHMIVPFLGLVTPGKLGEAAKVFLLGGDSKMTLGYLFVFERIFDLLLLLFVASFGLSYSDELSLFYLGFMALVVVAIYIFFRLDILILILRKVSKKMARFEPDWAAMMGRRLMQPKTLWVIPLTLLIWLVTFGASYCLARSVGIELTLWQIALPLAWGIVVGVISGLPGGHGAREMTIAFMFEFFYDIPKSIGGSFAVLLLVVNYVVLSLVALIGWLNHGYDKGGDSEAAG